MVSIGGGGKVMMWRFGGGSWGTEGEKRGKEDSNHNGGKNEKSNHCIGQHLE